MNNKLLSIILIIIIVIIVIYNNKYDFINNNDMFKNQYYTNPQDIIKYDGNMTFDYINDPNYTIKVLGEYYVNDDRKINGIKWNYHPYKNSVPNCENSRDLNDGRIYSANPSLHCRRNVGNDKTKWWWNKYDTKAVDIYNQYSIHR